MPSTARTLTVTDQGVARAVGSLHQALFSGVLTQWLIDPDRAPSAADLAAALQAITDQLSRLGGSPLRREGR